MKAYNDADQLYARLLGALSAEFRR